MSKVYILEKSEKGELVVNFVDKVEYAKRRYLDGYNSRIHVQNVCGAFYLGYTIDGESVPIRFMYAGETLVEGLVKMDEEYMDNLGRSGFSSFDSYQEAVGALALLKIRMKERA